MTDSPQPCDYAYPVAPGDVPYWQPGMTLRDYFAAQALASVGTWMPAHGGSDLGSKAAMQARALWAYEQADAMMAERAKVSDDA